MDGGAFVGVVLGLFFGGLSVAYGGFSFHTDYPLIAFLSYVLGGGCVAASVVLTFLRVERVEQHGHTEGPRISPTSPVPVPALAVATILPPVTHQTSQASERVYVDLTPEQLIGIFRTHVTAQAERLVERYIGKWLRVVGQVYDVDNIGDLWRMSLWFDSVKGEPGFLVLFEFHSPWRERLEILDKGTAIFVDGRIKEVDAAVMRLKECEVVA
jgi:hypothetical protein